MIRVYRFAVAFGFLMSSNFVVAQDLRVSSSGSLPVRTVLELPFGTYTSSDTLTFTVRIKNTQDQPLKWVFSSTCQLGWLLVDAQGTTWSYDTTCGEGFSDLFIQPGGEAVFRERIVLSLLRPLRPAWRRSVEQYGERSLIGGKYQLSAGTVAIGLPWASQTIVVE